MADKLNRKLKNIKKDDIPSTSSSTMDNNELLNGTCNTSFNFRHASQNEVYETLLKLNSSKGPGPDEMHVKVIKEVSFLISFHLSNLFNKCIDEGVYPFNLKFATCVAIHKGGTLDPMDPLNYRPISILNSLNKVFERLLHKQLIYYLETNNLLPNFQYGYRKKHSTCHAALDLTKEIESVLDDNEVAISIFMDLSKAFDTVDKKILCEKLNELGVRGVNNKLIENYMTGRYFFIKNETNVAYHMNYGVPQGSILGPLLFLIYIYDMKYIAELIKTIVYADDTTLIIRGRTVAEAKQKANAILDRFYNYFTLNKLTINGSKTKYMIFCPKNKRNINLEGEIEINNVTLEQVKTIKFLGLVLNDNLNWKDHKMYIKSKIQKNLGILYKCRQIMNLEECINMYNCFILPYLLYCLPVWGGTLTNQTDPIINVQNKVLRVLTNTKRTQDAWNYVRHKVLPVSDLYKVEIAKFCFKHTKRLLPSNFERVVMPVFANEIHNIATRHSINNNYQFN